LSPEKRFENELCAELMRRGVFAHHFDANGVDGWPDILAMRDDRVALIECKYDTEKLRTEQVAMHTRLMVQYGMDRVYTAIRWPAGWFELIDEGHAHRRSFSSVSDMADALRVML
jgi:Holliday junction resolvase